MLKINSVLVIAPKYRYALAVYTCSRSTTALVLLSSLYLYYMLTYYGCKNQLLLLFFDLG